MTDGAMGQRGSSVGQPRLGQWVSTSIEDVRLTHGKSSQQHDQRTLQNSMKQQAAKQPKAPTPASWKPGTSGNPNGRPRTGLAFAERIRERLDPDVVIDLVERHLADEDVPIAARLATVLPYIHAGFAKPATTTDINVNAGNAPLRDWSAMPIDERRELLAKMRSLPTLADSKLEPERRLPNASATDDNKA